MGGVAGRIYLENDKMQTSGIKFPSSPDWGHYWGHSFGRYMLNIISTWLSKDCSIALRPPDSQKPWDSRAFFI